MHARAGRQSAQRHESAAPAELPAAFIDRMAAMLGDELPAFLGALREPERGLRVNTLRLSVEDFLVLSPFPLVRLNFPETGLLVAAGEHPGKHPYHAAGLYYLQDAGAMVVGALVGTAPGERVLDLSAAPGGKATHLAAAMHNEGVLVANDVSRARAMELVGNLERCGVRNAIVTSETVERLGAHFGPYFDRVLVDAPCSGESMFHKSAAARADWSIEAVHGCARRQADLLGNASLLVRPGGLLVYSTCTFSREENEEVIERFLGEASEFQAESLPPVPGAVGAPEPVNLPGSLTESRSAAAYRLWPHRMAGAGHFVASLRRVDGVAGQALPSRRAAPPRDALDRYREFLETVYPGGPLQLDRLEHRGSNLYELPADAPSTMGLRVIMPGLRLGSLLTKRFEPAHAMAMAYASESAANRVELASDDPRVPRYLSGHPIEASGAPGWVPVLVDGFALGWGKRVGSTIKNHYPKGLRRPG